MTHRCSTWLKCSTHTFRKAIYRCKWGGYSQWLVRQKRLSLWMTFPESVSSFRTSSRWAWRSDIVPKWANTCSLRSIRAYNQESCLSRVITDATKERWRKTASLILSSQAFHNFNVQGMKLILLLAAAAAAYPFNNVGTSTHFLLSLQNNCNQE